MEWLRQSTAATLKVGPFLDITDGSTAKTALTIAQADVRLSKSGGNMAQKNEAASLTHDELGVYDCPVDVTDTNTPGRLRLDIQDAAALPVWNEYIVLPANVYDALVAGTDTLEADLTQMGGVAQSATDLKDFADEGYDPATNKIQGLVLADTLTTYTNNTPQTGDSFARLGAPDGASIAADLLVIDNFVDELESRLTAIRAGYLDNLSAGASALASVATEARLAELDAANIPTDIDGLTAAVITNADGVDIAADIIVVKAETTTIVEDTNELQADWTNTGRLDTILDIIAANTTTDIPALIAIAQADLDTLTGADGVTLASAQGNYAPAKAGDAMALTTGGVDDIWDEDVDITHQTAGTAGKKLDDAGGAADPWATAIPGAYGAGTAGKIVGDNINSPLGTIDGKLDTAQADLDIVTGTDGTTLATVQGNYAPNIVVPDVAGTAPTAVENRQEMETDGGDLSSLMEALVNKLLITEANGNAEIFNDAGVSQGTVASAITSVAGVTQRKRMVQ